ncbi:MAG: KamA family radical SAM protein [Candidatus Izemoplasmataceae bacterium]
MNAREVSLNRANELKKANEKFLDFKKKIKHQELLDDLHYEKKKQMLLAFFKATEKDWENHKWQMHNRIMDVDTLQNFVSLTSKEIDDIRALNQTNRFAISPYYLALVGEETDDPIKMQSIPNSGEFITDYGKDDPMAEEFTNPAGSITRRYPDRLIINVTNVCAMYCRHCQRRRLIGENDEHTPLKIINESIDYIKNNEEIRDVLVTGGDAFLLSNKQIEHILKLLRAIPHVEIIRFGTRTPVTLPMRITDELVSILKKYHPVYVNTHFNHPKEISKISIKHLSKLIDAGINVGNQAVLLKGINDHKYLMTYMNQKLLMARVRPYYIFHAKKVKGTSHFIPKISDGLEIMSFMRGHTSGMAIPTYIFNAPGGLGKIPLLPSYIISHEKDTYQIKTWEGNIITYKE